MEHWHVTPTKTLRTRRRPRRWIVVLVPMDVPLDAVLAAGFVTLSQVEIALLSRRMLRFSLPAGQSPGDAIADLDRLLSGAINDRNDPYRPDDFLCEGADCAAQAMIGWPSAMRPRLGMIDTGVNSDHPALRGQRLTVHQIDLGDRATAGRQHGTAIAAMLVGSVAGRDPGLLPDAEFIAVEAFHHSAGAGQADVGMVLSEKFPDQDGNRLLSDVNALMQDLAEADLIEREG